MYDVVGAFAGDRVPVDLTRFENVLHLSHTQNFDGITTVIDPQQPSGGPELHHLPADDTTAVSVALRAPRGIQIGLRQP